MLYLRSDPFTLSSQHFKEATISTSKLLFVSRRALALLLAMVLCSAQVFGQTLSTATVTFTEQRSSASSDAVSAIFTDATIRLAQNNPTGWPADIALDIDPPVIDHEALETGVPGQEQTFSAVVIDESGLEHVLLFHRDRSGAQYSSVKMKQTEGTAEFTATIDTSLGQNRIEYYIEALDTGGNRVLKGFPFFPLVRQLESAPVASTAAEETAAPQSRMIYVLLGVAAVGLALALSGGDDNPTVEPPPPPGTVPLNIEVNLP